MTAVIAAVTTAVTAAMAAAVAAAVAAIRRKEPQTAILFLKLL